MTAIGDVPPGRTVVIGGGGAAGLAAGCELTSAGVGVTVLEREASVGGRVRTIRFDGGVEVEGGPMRIPGDHNVTKAYVRQAGLRLKKFDNTNRRKELVGLGRISPEIDSDACKADAILGVAWGKLSDTDKESYWSNSPSAKLLRFDGQDLFGYFTAVLKREDRRLTTTDAESQAEGLLRASGLAPFGKMSLLDALFETQGIGSENCYTIQGGMDRLPNALAERIIESGRGEIRYRARVTGIALEDGGREVKVSWTAGEGTSASSKHTTTADAVILTPPPRALAQIRFSPDLPGYQRAAFSRATMGSGSKLCVAYRERFWESIGIRGGRLYIPGIGGQIVFPPPTSRSDPKRRGALVFYAWNDQARVLNALPDDQRRYERIVEGASAVFPELRDHVPYAMKFVDWDAACEGGSFLWPEANERGRVQEALRSPWPPTGPPRVFFAGEAQSMQRAWLNGAFYSGYIAAVCALKVICQPRIQVAGGTPT